MLLHTSPNMKILMQCKKFPFKTSDLLISVQWFPVKIYVVLVYIWVDMYVVYFFSRNLQMTYGLFKGHWQKIISGRVVFLVVTDRFSTRVEKKSEMRKKRPWKTITVSCLMPLHFPSEKKLERGGLLFTYLHSIFSKTKKCRRTLGVKFGKKCNFGEDQSFF